MTSFPTPEFAAVLAQTTLPAQRRPQRLWQTVGTALLLIVVGVALIWLAFWLKRQIFGGPTPTPVQAGGFTLSDLRRLRAEGKMTEAEFERAKALFAARREIIEQAGDEREGDRRTKDVDLIRDAE